VVDALLRYRRNGDIDLAAFVVMPDHWHALVGTREGETIAEFMRKLDRWVSRNTQAGLRACGCGWQEGFYETLVRSGRQFTFIRHYVEENPVRKGLALRACDWEWSSAHPSHQSAVQAEWSRVLPEL
jgi:REP element-mobilizing transposase RayT